jgi:hypothetical protein
LSRRLVRESLAHIGDHPPARRGGVAERGDIEVQWLIRERGETAGDTR